MFSDADFSKPTQGGVGDARGTELNTLRSKAESAVQPDKAYTAIATGEKDDRKVGEQGDFLDELLSISMAVDKPRQDTLSGIW